MTAIADRGTVCCRGSDDFLSFEVFIGNSFFATGSFLCAVVVEGTALERLVGNAHAVCGFALMHRPAHNTILLQTALLHRSHVLMCRVGVARRRRR